MQHCPRMQQIGNKREHTSVQVGPEVGIFQIVSRRGFPLQTLNLPRCSISSRRKMQKWERNHAADKTMISIP